MIGPFANEREAVAFRSKVQFGEGCWLWMGKRDSRGYGSTGWERASRKALAEALGRELEANEFACHECDNPPCVRVGPGHIYLGDAASNMRDRSAHGRARGMGAGGRLRIAAAVRQSWERRRQDPEWMARWNARATGNLLNLHLTHEQRSENARKAWATKRARNG